jgi:hypothetical protein
MSKQPDYTEAAEVFRKSMQEALANLDKQSEALNKAREQAIDQEIAAKDELHRIQNEAEKLSQEFITQHRKEYDGRLKNDTLMEVTQKLMQAGRSSTEIKLWLEVSDEMIAHAFRYLNFESLGDRMANVYYDNKGRAGDVYFNWDGLILKFPYEFGGGNTLATIDVPSPDHWEAETSIPVAQRELVLEFIAKRVVRDQAPEHEYKITDNFIQIYLGPKKY